MGRPGWGVQSAGTAQTRPPSVRARVNDRVPRTSRLGFRAVLAQLVVACTGQRPAGGQASYARSPGEISSGSPGPRNQHRPIRGLESPGCNADQEDHGRCVSCGFVAVTSPWSDDHTLREINLYQRQHAQLMGFPDCFVQAADLYEEVRDAPSKEPSEEPLEDAEPAESAGSEEFAAVIARDRRCPDWFRYQPGTSSC